MTPANQALPPVPGLAGPYRRLGARAIDLVIALFVLLPLSLALIALLGLIIGSAAVTGASSGFIDVVCILIVLLAYETLMTHFLGWTVGKVALGMKIVDASGNKLTWGKALLRGFLFWLSAALVIVGIVITASILGWVFFAGLGRYRRYPHEVATGSFVMMRAPQSAAQGVPQVQVSPYADLDRLRITGMITEEEYQRKKKELGIQ